MPHVIRHVDAFTTVALEGNPAAVVDGDGLSTESMQRIALNQKLSETVFLLPPESQGNHAKLRIFTPAMELPFAGHPVVASAHVLQSERKVAVSAGDALRLETGAGVIPVEVSGDPPIYTMTQATASFLPYDAALDDTARWIGLKAGDVLRAESVSTGLAWKIAQVSTLEAMMRVQPDMTALAQVPHGIAIFCIGALNKDAQVHVRAFAPDGGVPEDPVTGSANGCIAAFIAKHRLIEADAGEIAYVAEQGIEMGQPGRVYVGVSGLPEQMRVQVGGHAVTVLRGELLL
jgi:PhzF family phenazine biosynthesis protein